MHFYEYKNINVILLDDYRLLLNWYTLYFMYELIYVTALFKRNKYKQLCNVNAIKV